MTWSLPKNIVMHTTMFALVYIYKTNTHAPTYMLRRLHVHSGSNYIECRECIVFRDSFIHRLSRLAQTTYGGMIRKSPSTVRRQATASTIDEAGRNKLTPCCSDHTVPPSPRGEKDNTHTIIEPLYSQNRWTRPTMVAPAVVLA